MDGREVILFKQRLGADLMLATAQSQFIPRYGKGDWEVPGAEGKGPARHHARVYAKVTPKVGDGFVCRGDRSATICTGWFPDCRKALSAASGGAPVRGFRLTR
jgi:hypothetical protein